MATGRRIAVVLSAACVAAAVLSQPAPARADPGCSPQDIWNDLSNAWGGVTSGVCEAACATGFGCFAAFGAVTVLSALAAANDPSAVTSFCNAVQSVQGAANNAATIVGDLQAAGASQSLIDQLTSLLGSVADPLAAAQCACQEEQGLPQLVSEVGNCIVQGLCDVSQFFGTPCGCTAPPTTITGNCSATIAGCGDFNDPDPACQGGGPGNGPIMVQDGWSAPIMQINTPGGTEIIQSASGSAPFGTCGTSTVCFCPKPMIPVWVWNYANDSNAQNNDTQIFSCACPSGTTPAGVSQQNPSGTLDSNGLSSCICDNTGQPIMTGYGATFDNPCPTPLTGLPCPNGQIRFGSKCVPACAKNEVRTPDGNCCDPDQVTFCGQCCPSGETPNLTNGTCGPSQVAQ